MEQIFYMLVGLPGSGKSTYAQKLLDENYNIVSVSSDQIREQMFGDESIQGDPKLVFKEVKNRVIDNLKLGYSVILDATNVTIKNRRDFLNDIKSQFNITCECHVILAPIFECIYNQLLRSRIVTKDVIIKFAKRFQVPTYYLEDWDYIKFYNNTKIDMMLLEDDLIERCQTYTYGDNNEHSISRLDVYSNLSDYNLDSICYATIYGNCGKPFCKKEKNDQYYFDNYENVSSWEILSYGISNESSTDNSDVIMAAMLVERQNFDSSKYSILEKYFGKKFLNYLRIIKQAEEASLNE